MTIDEARLAAILAGIERRIRDAQTLDISVERGIDTHPQKAWPDNGSETLTLRFNGGAHTRHFDE